MPHKELVVYVSEYMMKNMEALKPIALSLKALCWPHMGKLDEVNILYLNIIIVNYYVMPQAMDALLTSCPDPIIEYSITIFGQKLNQVRKITHVGRDSDLCTFQWKILLDKLLQLVSQQQQQMADEHLSKMYPHLYKSKCHAKLLFLHHCMWLSHQLKTAIIFIS